MHTCIKNDEFAGGENHPGHILFYFILRFISYFVVVHLYSKPLSFKLIQGHPRDDIPVMRETNPEMV